MVWIQTGPKLNEIREADDESGSCLWSAGCASCPLGCIWGHCACIVRLLSLFQNGALHSWIITTFKDNSWKAKVLDFGILIMDEKTYFFGYVIMAEKTNLVFLQHISCLTFLLSAVSLPVSWPQPFPPAPLNLFSSFWTLFENFLIQIWAIHNFWKWWWCCHCLGFNSFPSWW